MKPGADLTTLRDLHSGYVNAVKEFCSPHEAAREATLVIEHLTGFNRTQQSVRGAEVFHGHGARFLDILKARRTRQPLAQILGMAPFRDRMFRVTPDVLCPRADTETLIDLALAARPRHLLDLGTGPGTIALTLLAECPGAIATATDISPLALGIAEENARHLGLSGRVDFVQSDWFSSLNGRFDLIASNPPYVDAATYATLQPEITRWEPAIALTPDGDGLEAYRIITAHACEYLTPGGHLMVEVGHDQGQSVAALFVAADLQDVTVHPDLGGHDRVVTGVWR